METQDINKRVEELKEFLNNIDFIEKLIEEVETPEKPPQIIKKGEGGNIPTG